MADEYLEQQLDRIERKLDDVLAQLAGQPAQPPVTSPPAPAVRYPADIFGPGWKLTLPVLAGSKAREVRQPELATYSSSWCELNEAGDGVLFRANHGAATTSGSKNPRSELREMTPDGRTEHNWSATSGRHVMTVDLAVNRLTQVKPHVVVAQIHGEDDDVTVWRVEGSKLWITRGDDTHAHLALDGLQLGQRIRVGFDVEGGRVRYTLDGAVLPFEVKTTDGACYFKTGCYLQSNPSTAPGESAAEYAEVELFGVTVTHA